MKKLFAYMKNLKNMKKSIAIFLKHVYTGQVWRMSRRQPALIANMAQLVEQRIRNA